MPGKEKTVIERDLKGSREAFKLLTEVLLDPDYGVIASMREIDAVGHRVLHGGSKYSEAS